MHFYKVSLPKKNHWDDEYDSWINSSFTSRMNDGYYQSKEKDIEEDDILPSIPNGSYMDDLSINDDEVTTII